MTTPTNRIGMDVQSHGPARAEYVMPPWFVLMAVAVVVGMFMFGMDIATDDPNLFNGWKGW